MNRLLAFAFTASSAAACAESTPPRFDQRAPAAGPGTMVAADAALNPLPFPGGDDPPLAPHAEAADGVCGESCRTFCEGASLGNPVHVALCPAVEGVGLSYAPVVREEACRRLFVDTLGRFPSEAEVSSRCAGRPFSEVVADLLADPAFLKLQQRRFADLLLYHHEVVSTARIWDADALVAKAHAGLVPWDQFASILAVHPVLTRRHANPADRAEAAFRMWIGRPPYQNERADLARLYTLWTNDYYEHPGLGRTPDAFIRPQCVTEAGERDPASAGQCTSVLWGFRELIVPPDARTDDHPGGLLWSGLLDAAEWDRLQEPGRVLVSQAAFWEHAVDQVVELYLGYDPSLELPALRAELVDWLLAHDGDIRAVHFAVLTSRLYLQTALGAASPSDEAAGPRWLSGPWKQADAEVWIDTLEAASGRDLGACDHRLPDPDRVLGLRTVSAMALVAGTDWPLRPDGTRIDATYRSLARSLGGCPENLAGGRFRTVSVLTTATQESFVAALCNPSLATSNEATGRAAAPEALVPSGMDPRRALDADVARDIFAHQTGIFFGRAPTDEERADAAAAAEACAPKPCTAEAFARPLCFALLSGAEALFY
jgi:hypothetical protein